MRRWLGIGMLVLSVLVLFTGWATWSSIGEEAREFDRARTVTAAELDKASDGELVLVEGTAQKQYEGPVTGDAAAWWRITRVQKWDARRAECKNNVPCRREWGARRKKRPAQAAPTLDVKLAGSDRILTIEIPSDAHAVTRVKRGPTADVPLDIADTDTQRNHHETHREYLLAPDAPVTLVGTVKGSGDQRTLVQRDGLSLVYNASKADMRADLRGYGTTGKVMVAIGILIAIGGVLVIRGRREKPIVVPDGTVRAKRLPTGMVIGGIDKPMSVNVRCPACGTEVPVAYHDAEARFHTARSPQHHVQPGWRQLDEARTLEPDQTPLDMTCPACARPLRVIVHGTEWRPTLWQFRLIEVLGIDSAESSGGLR